MVECNLCDFKICFECLTTEDCFRDSKGHPLHRSKDERMKDQHVCQKCLTHKHDMVSCVPCQIDLCKDCLDPSDPFFKKRKLGKAISGTWEGDLDYKGIFMRLSIDVKGKITGRVNDTNFGTDVEVEVTGFYYQDFM